MTGSVQDDELITPTERTHKLGTCLGMPTGSQKATSSALGDRLILTPPQKYDSVLSKVKAKPLSRFSSYISG